MDQHDLGRRGRTPRDRERTIGAIVDRLSRRRVR
jgi:hypothetical protein